MAPYFIFAIYLFLMHHISFAVTHFRRSVEVGCGKSASHYHSPSILWENWELIASARVRPEIINGYEHAPLRPTPDDAYFIRLDCPASETSQ